MRFKPRLWNDGDTWERSAFLWFPKKIDHEWRWLERANWVEEFHIYYDGGADFEPVKWLDT